MLSLVYILLIFVFKENFSSCLIVLVLIDVCTEGIKKKCLLQVFIKYSGDNIRNIAPSISSCLLVMSINDTKLFKEIDKCLKLQCRTFCPQYIYGYGNCE